MENKVSAASVDYMELPGAQKDADCRKIEVKGGVSGKLGCCNDFEWNKGTGKLFSCGTCEYVTGLDAKPDYFFGGKRL